MIPILYRVDELTFTANGLGRLSECVSCIVTEERNGIFELEYEYPITGRFYLEMANNGGVVGVIHDDHHDIQLFDIYAHTDPIDGIVKFNAHHISYRLNQVILKPFTGSSTADTLAKIPLNAINTCPFTFWTNKPATGTFTLSKPDNARAILGGQQGSVLDVYGAGDYEFNNWQVRLYTNRGQDTGVTIRYGKNLRDIENNVDDSGSYSAIVPYWVSSEGETVYGGMVVSPYLRAVTVPWTNEDLNEMEDGENTVIEFRPPIITPRAVDFSSDFEEQPTVEQLEERATQYMVNNQTWELRQNIKIDFVQLWQTPEYENVAALQRVGLCDYVSVYFPEMGIIQSQQKVIRVVYNVLLERYDEIELGQAQTTLSEIFESNTAEIIKQQSSELENLIKRQSDLITGGLGGYVVTNLNASGQPQEILIMDTDDIDTAVHVIRLNRNGIGFSKNGYDGPYESAWTIDGTFNADFIAAGTISANLVRGGTLVVGGMNNYYGVIQVLDANGQTVGTWQNGGIVTNEFRANFNEGYLAVGTQGFFAKSGSNTVDLIRQDSAGISTYGWRTLYKNGSKHDVSYMFPGNLESYCATEGSGGLLTVSSSFKFDGNASVSYHTVITGGLSSDTLKVSGTKSRIADAAEFGERLLYCYETPTPMFGDIGEGVIDETGFCYIFLDPVFAETISTDQYQVFLQKYGRGECWIAERHSCYFVVEGDPGLSFGWELKAKQKGFDQRRLDPDVSYDVDRENYGEEGNTYYIDLMEGRIA